VFTTDDVDGSLNCPYPKEIAMFLLQGFAGSFPQYSNSTDIDLVNMNKAFMNIVWRVLGAKIG
jgi:hypothetical protein